MQRTALRVSNLPATDLTDAREAELFDGLADALPNLRMRELFRLRGNLFREVDLITVAESEKDGEVVGVLASQWSELDDGVRFLHVTSQFVGDHWRQAGVFRASWSAHLRELSLGLGFPPIIALKTYNPVVFCAMRTLGRFTDVSFYPTITGAPADPGSTELACRIAEEISPRHPFDPVTGVISGIGVPRDLYPALPRSSDAGVNAFFARATKPGDRVLCLLNVPTRRAVQTVMRLFDRGVPAT